MSRIVTALALVLALAVAVWIGLSFLAEDPTPDPAPDSPEPSSQPGRTPVTPPPANPTVAPPKPAPAPAPAPKTSTPSKADTAPPPPPAPKMAEDEPARAEADSIALNLRHYGQRFDGNPVGTNAEIVKSLMGGNQAGVTYLPPNLQRLNEDGELIDRWGTPYFFHQNSDTDTEVRSAGPDTILWTEDDVIAK